MSLGLVSLHWPLLGVKHPSISVLWFCKVRRFLCSYSPYMKTRCKTYRNDWMGIGAVEFSNLGCERNHQFLTVVDYFSMVSVNHSNLWRERESGRGKATLINISCYSWDRSYWASEMIYVFHDFRVCCSSQNIVLSSDQKHIYRSVYITVFSHESMF